METVRIKFSFQKYILINHNLVAKIPISHRKYHVRIPHFCRYPQEAARKRTAWTMMSANENMEDPLADIEASINGLGLGPNVVRDVPVAEVLCLGAEQGLVSLGEKG